jgi:hypothetical protein
MLLREFDIKPRTVRRGVETDNGHKREWFDDAFARYLPPRSVTPSQSSDLAGFAPDRSVTPGPTVTYYVTDRDCEKARIPAGCDGVTDRNAVSLEEETVRTG